MRAVEDHHVDRLGVEAQQCVKLTSTNRSIGLIALIVSASPFCPTVPYRALRYLRAMDEHEDQIQISEHLSFVGLVILAEREHPIQSRTRP